MTVKGICDGGNKLRQALNKGEKPQETKQPKDTR